MFLTFDEYWNGAQRILNLYGYNIHKNDDDAISFVASYMIRADETWDGSKSSRNYWRFNNARYAILKLKNQYRKQKKVLSLNLVIRKNKNSEIVLGDIIVSPENMENTIIKREQFNYVMTKAKNVLSPRQLECFTLYYQNSITMEEIGNKLNLTKQAVSFHIKNALSKVKNECKN